MTHPLPTAPSATPPATPTSRHDGWTLARQRRFCELLAEHGNVGEAARRVGMSKQSAYSLRRRAAGAAFALGWDAAIGIARRRLIDEAMELATEGVHDIYSKDGEVVSERRRRDPRVMLAVAERLARMADKRSETARRVELTFDDYLDCLARGGGGQGEDGANSGKVQAPGASARKALLGYFAAIAPHPGHERFAFLDVDTVARAVCGDGLIDD